MAVFRKESLLVAGAALLLLSSSQVEARLGEPRSDEVSERSLFQVNPDFLRFCGMAINQEAGNGFDQTDLAHAVSFAGQGKVWQYNWDAHRKVEYPFVQYVPMLKYPGYDVNTLPPPGANGGSGTVVKGWNEPDDAGQAGADWNLRSNPAAYVGVWTDQMRQAEAKGYKTFVSPAMAQDTCWLDHFLKACEGYQDCRRFVTHIAFHRYRTDCGSYTADPNNMGFRDDLSYLLSYYRLMKKYNARGFNIQGLVFDEIGCYSGGWLADEWQNQRYLEQFFRDTIVRVKQGDQGAMEKIRNTQWIMPKGPDAHAVGNYWVGQCHGEVGGPNAGAESVLAIQSLVTVAWFSIHQGRNYLFNKGTGTGLSPVGETYFTACRQVDAAAQPFTMNSLMLGASVRLRNVASGRTLVLPNDQTRGEIAAASADLLQLVPEGDGYRIKLAGNKVLPGQAASSIADLELYANERQDRADGFGADSTANTLSTGLWKLHEGQDEFHVKVQNLLSNRWLYEEASQLVGATNNEQEAGDWRVEIVPADELTALAQAIAASPEAVAAAAAAAVEGVVAAATATEVPAAAGAETAPPLAETAASKEVFP
mmetsp:Transcript_82129/g.171939  ORF Transcript_82129/g.171939 Transcript_82129/m.171939 type:complete len:593 (+) Transcript_82129:219-1997(+)|eukprot:CAMPEP_0206444084 /NCGR_PEP_ID=MMETSP0324_2-20121206/14721_1 /ASSEMBLY_ACC=CAM_ASM_000836 /TAXON_ID=2866 /ORGANISM="Crypthecodinium cohnii, Strain Seligo" /LENGTH=592 /DNA_ID=CAMNT_0053912079 /DNA_START=152 /DNA_END=1930 /DNA_ORIENTATION=+